MHDQYKLTIFYKNTLHVGGIIGHAIVRKGKKDYVIEKIRSELDKARKMIIELV